MSDHLFPFKLYAAETIGAGATLTSVGIPCDRLERLESLEFLCTADTKIDAFGSSDGVTADTLDTQAVKASTGAMSKADHIPLDNFTAPFVIITFKDLGAGGAVTAVVWARENTTPLFH